MVSPVGIAPTSPRFQRGANLTQLRKHVLLRDNSHKANRTYLILLSLSPYSWLHQSED